MPVYDCNLVDQWIVHARRHDLLCMSYGPQLHPPWAMCDILSCCAIALPVKGHIPPPEAHTTDFAQAHPFSTIGCRRSSAWPAACRPSSVPCSPSAAACRQLALDRGRLPAAEAVGADHGSPSGLSQEASKPEASDRSQLRSDHNAAHNAVEAVRSGAALPPLPEGSVTLSHCKLPAAEAPALIELQARAGGSWQQPHVEEVAASGSLPNACNTAAPAPAAGHADPAATAVEQQSSTAEPKRCSPEPHSPAHGHQAVVSSGGTASPSGGHKEPEMQRGHVHRAMSLREAYGGTPSGPQAAAADERQSSRPQSGGLHHSKKPVGVAVLPDEQVLVPAIASYVRVP